MEDDSHVLFMRSGSEIIYICMLNGCGKQFSRKDRLSVHQRTHTGDRPFKCEEEGCTKSYCRRAHLCRHQQTTHRKSPEKEKVFFRCEAEGCTSMFTQYHNMQKHFKIQHSKDAIRPYKCEVEGCEAAFRKYRELRIHGYTHANLDVMEPFACIHPGCMRSFPTGAKLRRHAKMHEGYRCPNDGCGQVFAHWTELRTHRSKAHVEEFPCEACNKTFPKRYMLNAHHRSHHAKLVALPCPREGCLRRYWDKKNLKAHISSFHDHQRYICSLPFCGKTFVSKQRLRVHIAQHGEGWSQFEETKEKSGRTRPRKKTPHKRRNAIRELTGIKNMEVKHDLDPVQVEGQTQDQGETESHEDFTMAESCQKGAQYESKAIKQEVVEEAEEAATGRSLSDSSPASFEDMHSDSAGPETKFGIGTPSVADRGFHTSSGSRTLTAASEGPMSSSGTSSHDGASSVADSKASLDCETLSGSVNMSGDDYGIVTSRTTTKVADSRAPVVADKEALSHSDSDTETPMAFGKETLSNRGAMTLPDSLPTSKDPGTAVDSDNASLSPDHHVTVPVP